MSLVLKAGFSTHVWIKLNKLHVDKILKILDGWNNKTWADQRKIKYPEQIIKNQTEAH